MCKSGRACARIPASVCARGPRVRARVRARPCLCTYICRENVSTIAGFRHFPAADICICVGFSEHLSPRGVSASGLSWRVSADGNIFQRLFRPQCQLLRDSSGASVAIYRGSDIPLVYYTDVKRSTCRRICVMRAPREGNWVSRCAQSPG